MTGTASRHYAHWWWHHKPLVTGTGALLLVLCGINFLDAIDVSSMGPTLPKLQRELHTSPSALQWVVSAYVLGYGGFLLLGGRIADLYSRRRLLLASLAVFAMASLVGGLSDSATLLVGARLVKGISAAFTAPAALAILLATYREPEVRDRALGRFISIAAAGFALGLVLGGALAGASWRLTLLLPTGLAAILLAAATRIVPTDSARVEPRGRLDITGAIVVTAGLVALVYGVSHACTSGWTDAASVAALVTAVVLLAAFAPLERTRRAPLVPLGILRRPGLARAVINALFFQGIYVAFQFVATLYYQNVLDWTPLEAGLAFLLGGLLVLVLAPRFARLVERLGPWRLVSFGMALQTLGYLWFTRLAAVDPIVLVLVQQALVGVGFAAVYPSLNIAAVRNARPEEQGVASGMFIAAVQIGTGIVVAVVASVFAANAGPGLRPYHAGIWTVVGIAAAATAIAATALVPHRGQREGRSVDVRKRHVGVELQG